VDFSVRVDGSALVVTVVGRLIADQSARLGRALEEALAEAPDDVQSLLLNMRDVPYIDSQGLGSVIRGQQAAAAKGGRVALAEPAPHISRLFTVTKLTNVVSLHDDEASALAALASQETL
jgi:stage II sporulation protein AA (anti-sigma F factor antagonist)